MGRNSEVAVVQRGNTLPMARPEVTANAITPAVDIYETADAFMLMLDMPGASKESISVSLDNSALVVKAAVGPYHKENVTMLLNELQSRFYYRVFNLADGIDRSNVDARYENGVLGIKLYKSEDRRPKEVPVR